MSEEEVQEVQEEEQPQETQEGGNKIFDALYNAATEEQEEEEVQEEFVPPSSLQSALHDIGNQQEVEQVEEQPKEEPKVEEKAEEPKPKHKSRVKKKIVDPEFKQPQQQAPKPETKDDPFIKELLPEEMDRYEIAKWASENLEDQKELASEYLNFFKRHKSFLQKNKDEYGDVASSDEYKNFIKKFKPKANMRTLEREMLTAQAEKRALERISPYLQKMEREQMKTRGAPKAKELTVEALKDLTNSIPEKQRGDIVKDAKAFAANNPLEADIVQKSLNSSKSMIEAFYNIIHDVVDYDENNQLHKRVSDFITSEQDKFINSGRTVKGGKTFVRRERMPLVPKDQKDKYYTFTDSDIIRLIKLRAGQNMESQINQIQELIAKAGYVRNQQVQEQPVQEQPVQQQQSPPSPRIQAPTQRAGVSAPTAPATKEGNPILKLLDL